MSKFSAYTDKVLIAFGLFILSITFLITLLLVLEGVEDASHREEKEKYFLTFEQVKLESYKDETFVVLGLENQQNKVSLLDKLPRYCRENVQGEAADEYFYWHQAYALKGRFYVLGVTQNKVVYKCSNLTIF